MSKKTLNLTALTQNQITRRSLLSLPVLAGGMLLLNPTTASAGLLTFTIVQENTSTVDSLALYTNLLPEVRRYELASALQRLDNEKLLVYGGLRKVIKLAQSLDSKYRGASSANSADVLTDLRRMTGHISGMERLADTLDATRNKLSFIKQFDSEVDSIHALLLGASADFANARDQLTAGSQPLGSKVTPVRPLLMPTVPNAATPFELRERGKRKLDDAIASLKGLLNRPVNEETLESPLERFIVLLLGVRVAVDTESSRPDVIRHHASSGGIMSVLRTHVKPGSWIQMGVGYAVAFPVLIRNKDRGIREKLLMDGLRLVPGLVPSPLIDTAKALSALSL